MLVLVVDDDPGVRRMLSLTFRSSGYDVTTAGDGRQALDQLAARAPDAIVLDLQMPVMDGEAFLREVRHRGIDTPVIVASGKPGVSSALGADAFFRKPFLPDDLVGAVERLTAAA